MVTNSLRADMLQAAIAQSIGGPPDTTTLEAIFEACRAILPSDFQLEMAEFTDAFGAAPSEEAKQLGLQAIREAMDTPDPRRVYTLQEQRAAEQRVTDAHGALFERRAELVEFGKATRAARAAVAQAVMEFQTGKRPTPSELIRQHIAGQQAEKALRAGGQIPPRTAGRGTGSYWDRVCAYGMGGDSNDFLRKRFQNGGNRRGAYPASALGRRVRPPSER